MNPSTPAFHAFDWLLLAILIWSTISAFLRGIVLELFSLGGLIAGILFASWNYQHLSPLLASIFHSVFNPSAATCNLMAFLFLVIGIMLLAAIAGRLIRRTAHTIGLGFLDRLFGGLFGLARGCLLGVALLMAAAAFFPHSEWISNSRLTPYFLDGVHAVSFVVPQGLRQQLLNGIAELKHNAPDWIKLHP
jgi:membrane protein required for colicin V production